MTSFNKMRLHLLCAALAGLALRLFFVIRFPFTIADDTKLYEELAGDWLKYGVYGVVMGDRVVPVDVRMPGYPAFLAAIHGLFGWTAQPVLVAQAIIDLTACFTIAALAASLVLALEGGLSRIADRASETTKDGWQKADCGLASLLARPRRAAIAALWLAALCPFTANYVAAPLSETLAIFFTALALFALVSEGALGKRDFVGTPRLKIYNEGWFFLGGLFVGLGTLVRPETPLVLVAAGLVFVLRWRRRRDWMKLIRAGLLMGLGLLLPLVPWAARNWLSLHRIEFLTPRYSELPGEYVPRGFYAWTKTWLWRFRDVYLVPWKLGDDQILIDQLPAYAFDFPRERERVAALLDSYNQELALSPEIDREFAELARERTQRHPLRTYLFVPAKRSAAMGFTPRIEMLPFTGGLWPIGESWENDPVDFSFTAVLGALNFFYVGLAVAGAWRARHSRYGWGIAVLVAFILIRTAFLTQVETPEPRYVLECFPAVLALGALVWSTEKKVIAAP